MLGRFASQIATLQQERRPTSTHPKNMGLSQSHGIAYKTKSFKDVMRECYWKRDQARRFADRDAVELRILRTLERDRLYGFVITIDGRKLTIDEANSLRDNGLLTMNEVRTWHKAEIYSDMTNSIGEKDSLGEYPALGVNKGDVLRDPKMRYTHPALRAG